MLSIRHALSRETRGKGPGLPARGHDPLQAILGLRRFDQRQRGIACLSLVNGGHSVFEPGADDIGAGADCPFIRSRPSGGLILLRSAHQCLFAVEKRQLDHLDRMACAIRPPYLQAAPDPGARAVKDDVPNPQPQRR